MDFESGCKAPRDAAYFLAVGQREERNLRCSGNTMKKIHHLRRKKDFETLFKTGRRISTPLFRIVVGHNRVGGLRAAFVTPRAIEKRAVLRNRIRRRAREWVRRHPALLASPLDVAFIFSREAVRAKRSIFYETLAQSIEKIIRTSRKTRN